MNLDDIKLKQLAPHLPWNHSKADDLGRVVMEFVQDQDPYFRQWIRKFSENYHWLFGNHRINWSRRHDFAVDTDILHQKSNNIFHQSQTNIVRLVVESLSSMIYGSVPQWDTESMDKKSVESKRFSEIVKSTLDAYTETLCMDQEFSNAASLFALFGQVGGRVSWNKLGGKQLEIPIFKDVDGQRYGTYMGQNPVTMGLMERPSPIIGPDGMPARESRFEQQMTDAGAKATKKIQAGDVKIDILTPLEYRRQPGSHGMHKTKWVQHIRLLDYDEWLDEYAMMPGKTEHFSKVYPNFANVDLYRLAHSHYMRLKFVTSPLQEGGREKGYFMDHRAFSSKIMVVEHYDAPHARKWPDGRRIVVANGQCTHINTPDFNTGKADGWHPFAEANWLRMVPSVMSSGPINDVIEKNKQLNTTDSLIATALRRNMGSQLLIRNSDGLDEEKITGIPGSVHKVNDPMSAARWLHDDMPISPIIDKLRQNAKQDVYESSGVGDAIRGDRSVGVSSGYHAKQIEEREQKRLTQPKRSFEMFVSTLGEKVWTCLAQNAVALGDDVVGYLKRNSAAKFSVSDVMKIILNRQKIGVEVRIVKNSMAIKSKATHQATLLELVNGPAKILLQDPKIMDQMLTVFDAQELRGITSKHRDVAERENEVFSDMIEMGPGVKSTKPTVVLTDDDDIHMAEHDEWFLENKEEILRTPFVLNEFLMHQEWHRIQKQEKLAEQMPGTALLTPQMYSQAGNIPAPNLQQVNEYNMRKLEAPAPRQPKAEPGGPSNTQTDPNAPSENTSAAAQGGPPEE